MLAPAFLSSGQSQETYGVPRSSLGLVPNISAMRRLAKPMVPSGATRMIPAWEASKITLRRSSLSLSSRSTLVRWEMSS